MKSFFLTSSCTLWLQLGDITEVSSDAIVNAANERMLGGLGVDGAIHAAAGPRLQQACREIVEIDSDVRCPEGQARITPGFQLRSRYVIHTVGPVYESPEESSPILESAYKSTLELANQYQLQSIAFPAISCGIFGYPAAEAAVVAIRVCEMHAGNLREIRFVLFDQANFESWRAVADEILGQSPRLLPIAGDSGS